jgi:HK97 family phage major capsid protein
VVNFCKPTVKPLQNSVFNILFPIGIAMLGMFALLAFGIMLMHQNTSAGIKAAEISTAGIASIKTAFEEFGRTFESFKRTNDERIEAIRSGQYGKANELEQKVNRIEADLQELTRLKDSLEDFESRVRAPGFTSATDKRVANPEYSKAFDGWLRSGGKSQQHESIMADLGRKDITLGSNAGGGYALPKEIARDIEKFELRFSPVRRLVRIERPGTSDFHFLLNIRGTTSGWSSETGTRGASNTPQLRDIVPTWGELYAYPQVSNWALQDMQFDAGAWLAENIADEFSLQEGRAVLTGNGSNKPTGMLNTTPVTTADTASPVRAAAAYQYIDSTASPFSVNANDALISLVYALNSNYRSGATWIMNSNTIAAIRKLKASTSGDYLWTPSLAAGTPNLLLGYPQETFEDMDDIGSGKFPVGFGDWRRAYLLCDRGDLQITRDEVTSPGFTKFFVRRREAGLVLNNDAGKFIRTA